MHFNRNDLLDLASRPSHDFNKEGILMLLEKQEGIFKRNEEFIKRWCRLRGNLLFFFKSSDHCSDPCGIIVLENFQINEEEFLNMPHSFTLVHEANSQTLAAANSQEKATWINALQRASFSHLKGQIDTLLHHVKISQQDNLISLSKYRQCSGTTIDLGKPPFVEMSITCDNLRCSGSGKPPNPRVCVYVMKPPQKTWIFYAQTEVVEATSNPTFLSTLSFRTCDGIDAESRLCFIVSDVHERVTDTTHHLGKTMINIQDLMEAGRTRLFLLSPDKHTVGFISLNTWFTNVDTQSSQDLHATPKHQSSAGSPIPFTHRRTQSLPPKLSFLVKHPSQGILKLLYENPTVSTFRFHSGLGGDISAIEIMAEPILSFKFPQQLLRLWINEERLSQEEVTCLGDLREKWNRHQLTLVTQHSTLINMYGIALGSLESCSESGTFFKKSVEKNERALEFAPLNLHLQRMFAQNDSLRRSEFYDILTVGAFCANSLGFKNGGLFHMLQSMKSSSDFADLGNDKCTKCEEIVDHLRRLRKEIFILLRLVIMTVRNKDVNHMLRIIDQLEGKIEILLRIIEPSLIMEALAFVDQIRIPQRSLTVARESNDNTDDKQAEVTQENEKAPEEIYKFDFYQSKFEENSDYNSNCCYKSTDEPEPWDLIELNIRASLICLSSKVRNYCQRLTEEQDDAIGRENDDRQSATQMRPRVRASSSQSSSYRISKSTDSPHKEDDNGIALESLTERLNQNGSCLSDLSTETSNESSSSCSIVNKNQPSYSITKNIPTIGATTEECSNTSERKESTNNISPKFDEGIEHCSPKKLVELIDWIAEIRPAMKKLRQALDGLMRTTRLTNSVFRLKYSPERSELNYSIKYRKDICFSQALTSVVTGLLTKIWCRRSDSHFASILTKIGPLVEFEVLLSCYRADGGRLSDMITAVEDLRAVEFVMVPEGVFTQSGYYRSKDSSGNKRKVPCPRVVGTRRSLRVVLPVPEQMLSLFPHRTIGRALDPPSFRITPVLFNIGINEEASLAAKMNTDGAQFRTNHDNFERLLQYYHSYKNHFIDNKPNNVSSSTLDRKKTSLNSLINQLHDQIYQQKSKNVTILQLASKICRNMEGIRFTSCKSAKDRTGMSTTLEQVNILKEEFDLAETEYKAALDCIRLKGTRRENCEKNTGQNRYAFSSIQLATFPSMYKPPRGSFGATKT